MKLNSTIETLIDVTVAVNTAQTGTAYKVRGYGNDDTPEYAQNVQVYFKTVQSGGATSPTTQAKLQTSMDNTNWIDLVSSTQLTADGTKVEVKDHTTVTTPLCKYVRVITVLGGGTAPNHTVTAYLMSDAPLKLEAV